MPSVKLGGKNGRAIFDSSTLAHPPTRPLLPFSIFHFHRPFSFFFSFLGGAAARADVLRLGNPQTTEGSFPVR